jgi:hypothetical protein
MGLRADYQTRVETLLMAKAPARRSAVRSKLGY